MYKHYFYISCSLQQHTPILFPSQLTFFRKSMQECTVNVFCSPRVVLFPSKCVNTLMLQINDAPLETSQSSTQDSKCVGLGLKHQHATEAKQQLCCLLNTCWLQYLHLPIINFYFQIKCILCYCCVHMKDTLILYLCDYGPLAFTFFTTKPDIDLCFQAHLFLHLPAE